MKTPKCPGSGQAANALTSVVPRVATCPSCGHATYVTVRGRFYQHYAPAQAPAAII